MKKITYLIAALIMNYVAYSQNQHGILVKTTLFPWKGWYGSHGGVQQISIGAKSINKKSNTEATIKTDYNFVYINDEPINIQCTTRTAGNYDNTDCGPISKNILYDKETFIQSTFKGCIANSEIYGIHLIRTDSNSNKCPDDTIKLTNGWNWQYSFDGTNWIDFAANFQDQRAISFTIKELVGFENKIKIYFRTGYKTEFTNILPYDIITCSPLLEHNPPLVSNPSCNNTATGSIPLKFKSDIKDDEQLLLNLFTNANPAKPQFLLSKFVEKKSILNKEYTWTNIGAGNYIIRYQAQKNTDNTTDVNSSAVTTEAFSIVDPPIFSFSTTETQPQCNGAKGTITITASGGTPPYYYYLNDDPKIEFTSPKIIDVDGGDNYIKVEDSKYCIDNTKNDKK